MNYKRLYISFWFLIPAVFWGFVFLVILALCGCSEVSQKPIDLQGVKDLVDSKMTYKYCVGWDCPANCAAFAKAYKKEAEKIGEKGFINTCTLENGVGHAWFQTYQGEVLDVRRTYVSDYDMVGCK